VPLGEPLSVPLTPAVGDADAEGQPDCNGLPLTDHESEGELETESEGCGELDIEGEAHKEGDSVGEALAELHADSVRDTEMDGEFERVRVTDVVPVRGAVPEGEAEAVLVTEADAVAVIVPVDVRVEVSDACRRRGTRSARRPPLSPPPLPPSPEKITSPTSATVAPLPPHCSPSPSEPATQRSRSCSGGGRVSGAGGGKRHAAQPPRSTSTTNHPSSPSPPLLPSPVPPSARDSASWDSATRSK
jgi:hypothetical protein